MENSIPNLMQHDRIQYILNNIPSLLRKFSPEDLRGFLMSGELVLYHRDQIILKESSDRIDEAWLIADGRVSIWKDGVEVAQQVPGDFIGETFLFSKGTRSATVKSDTEVAMLRFERDNVLQFFRNRPERVFKIFIMNLLEIQQQKITSMNNQVSRLKKKLLENQPESE